MGLYVFRLPDIGEGTAEAEIVEWHVKVGDAIEEDQTLVDVMTDKATVDITSPINGVVTAIHGNIGDQAAVGAALVELEVEGPGNVDASASKVEETPKAPASQEPVRKNEDSSEQKPDSGEPVALKAAREKPPSYRYPLRDPGDEPLAAPATRKRAYELGIPLQFVPGTGPGGRITPEDLDAYVEQGGSVGSANSARVARTTVNLSLIHI